MNEARVWFTRLSSTTNDFLTMILRLMVYGDERMSSAHPIPSSRDIIQIRVELSPTRWRACPWKCCGDRIRACCNSRCVIVFRQWCFPTRNVFYPSRDLTTQLQSCTTSVANHLECNVWHWAIRGVLFCLAIVFQTTWQRWTSRKKCARTFRWGN